MKLIKSLTGMVTGVLIIAQCASAQPTRDRILDDVHISDKNGCYTIKIAFTFPVSYIRHFPFDKGDELQIQIEPINLGPLEQQAISSRESIKPPHNKKVPLDEVTFDGSIEGGPFLNLYFTKVVNYEVGQGSDFRSILVSIRNQDPGPDTETCPHLPKNKK